MERAPNWLHRDFILGYFGDKVSGAQLGYKEFVSCRKHTGEKLKAIDAQFGIGDAAVAQSCKRFNLKLEKGRKLRERIERFKKRGFCLMLRPFTLDILPMRHNLLKIKPMRKMVLFWHYNPTSKKKKGSCDEKTPIMSFNYSIAKWLFYSVLFGGQGTSVRARLH